MRTLELDFSDCQYIPCYSARKLAREAGRKRRAEQGLPAKLSDSGVIERLAALIAPRR